MISLFLQALKINSNSFLSNVHATCTNITVHKRFGVHTWRGVLIFDIFAITSLRGEDRYFLIDWINDRFMHRSAITPIIELNFESAMNTQAATLIQQNYSYSYIQAHCICTQ